jgi:hypothetical protein
LSYQSLQAIDSQIGIEHAFVWKADVHIISCAIRLLYHKSLDRHGSVLKSSLNHSSMQGPRFTGGIAVQIKDSGYVVPITLETQFRVSGADDKSCEGDHGEQAKQGVHAFENSVQSVGDAAQEEIMLGLAGTAALSSLHP